ncbi:hypothetical protein WJX84_002375 [Apatococcus fuscideae]|uniref:Glycosyltransferase family 92 protein n=1 Tax=Apatococcus fuscideae TaxID=2026836 RepID=A0AAW1STL1_9CHLO
MNEQCSREPLARRSGRQRRTQHRNLNTSASLLVRKREYLHKPSSSPEDAGQLSSASSARNTPRLPRQRQSERVWASPRSAVLGADLQSSSSSRLRELVGITSFVIYDDSSADNVGLLETLYREHGRHYIRVEPPAGHGLDNNARRSLSAGHCSQHYGNSSDWMINLDVDEFVFSPAYQTLQEYFATVADASHMLYVGATRFGWAGQRHRFTYALHKANSSQGQSVELTNPNGVQLLTAHHVHRAPENRFGEPEAILRDSNARCREWQASQGELSPCTNDYNGRYGKAFVRTKHAVSVWTHGGGVRGNFGEASMFDGSDGIASALSDSVVSASRVLIPRRQSNANNPNLASALEKSQVRLLAPAAAARHRPSGPSRTTVLAR